MGTVVVDDQIPWAGKGAIFATPVPVVGEASEAAAAAAGAGKEKFKFWVSIIEKAFAKRHSGYEAIEAGFITDALTDLTGQTSESFLLDNDEVRQQVQSGKLWQSLIRWHASKYLMGAGSGAGSDTDTTDS